MSGVIMLSESPLRQAATFRARLVARMAALLFAIWAGVGLLGAGSALADDPPKGVFIYTILRNGDPVGQQRLEFVGDGKRLRVLSHTTLDVNFLGMNLYGFEQQVEEVHEGDRIVTLTSEADDDGTDKKVTLKLDGERLKGNYNGDTPRSIDPTLKTTLFWQQPAIGTGRLLDLLRAKVRDVTVTDLGAETLGLPAGKIVAHHLRVSGEIQRDLWYDPGGILVAGELKAKDGSTVRQELLQRP
jgi:hypothetical protein